MGDEGFTSRLWGGMRRAYGLDEGPTTDFLGRLRTGLGRAYGDPGPHIPFMPSRVAVREAVEDPKDREKNLREEYAASQAARNQAAEDPRNVVTQERGSDAPRDPKRDPVGTGTDLSPLTSHTPAAGYDPDTGRGQRERRVVRMPDGRVVVSEDPAGVTAREGGRVDPPGGRANVVAGSAGTVFSSPEMARLGPGGADLGETTLPGRDRSPGWAARAAINELYRTGEISADPLQIESRRRWEEQETARDMARERAEVEHEAALRTAMMPPVDPYRMAEIEAMGRYGGRGLQEEMTNERIMGALALYTQISGQIRAIEEQMNVLDPKTAQYQALAQQRDRLIQDRREMPNLALGVRLQDPRLDPLAAMLAFMGGPRAATEEGR